VDLNGKAAWVVGASSGIGAAVARELVSRGARVAITARRKDRLEEVAGGGMLVAPADVTDAGQLREAADLVRAELGSIDLVVLAAGFWQQMDASDWDTEAFAEHVKVNLVGMSNGIGAVLPEMMAAGSGVIAGVASVAGYRGIARSEAYGATKAGQINLLEALRTQVARRGIHVTTICPGFVRTEMTVANDFPMPFIIETDVAGRAICDGLERDRHEIVFPKRMAVLMKVARFIPVSLWTQIFSRAQK